MLLRELVARHSSDGGRLFALADVDYAGFRSLKPAPFAGEVLKAGDVLLADGGMADSAPWEAAATVPEGVPVIVVLSSQPAELQIGQVVQSAVTAGLDFLDATAIEQVYQRPVAVVGVKGGQPSGEERLRRVTWEWACGDLIARARDVELANVRREAVQAHSEVEAQRAAVLALEAEKKELQRTAEQARGRLADAEREVRELKASPALRVGNAVLAARHNPIAATRSLGNELIASRRRHRK